jgi:integrase
MRRGEVMNLRWDDVDLGRGFLKLRDPKGKRDQYVPLSDEALELLKNHPRENEYVFTQEYGSPRSKSRVALSSSAIKRAAGLPDDFRPNHGLRHSFASALADSGEVTLQQLMALLTHKTPSMTMRYSHLSDQALKRSANVMSRIVKNAEESNGEGNIA